MRTFGNNLNRTLAFLLSYPRDQQTLRGGRRGRALPRDVILGTIRRVLQFQENGDCNPLWLRMPPCIIH